MNALLDEYTDAQVAAVLNERGLRTGAGDAFDPVSVQRVRALGKRGVIRDESRWRRSSWSRRFLTTVDVLCQV